MGLNVKHTMITYINVLIVVLLLIILNYINNISNIETEISANIIKLYSNKFFIFISVVIIIIASLGINGIGGPWLGVSLAIIFLMLNTIVSSKTITNHLREQFV